MKTTVIRSIPHKFQRYPTVGDYYDRFNTLNIMVSNMNNDDYEFLVSIHEQIEEHLTRKRGIKEEDITKFDEAFEKKRLPDNYDEPGDNVNAPYYKEHQFATVIERMIASELDIDWKVYDETVSHLGDDITAD